MMKDGKINSEIVRLPKICSELFCVDCKKSSIETMGAIKTAYLKKRLGKKIKQNRPIPHFIRLQTDNTIR